MGILKKLFNFEPDEDKGLYYYIRLDRSDEVVQLRFNPGTDLTQDYETNEREVRKTIIGPKTYKRAEAHFVFDSDIKLVEWDISGGELVGEQDWLDFQQQTR